MREAAQKRPVIEKLAKILGQIKRVPKNGRNDFHKYDYVMEADLADAIRDHLADAGLMLVPSVRADATKEKEITGRNGKTELLVTVTLDVTIIDGESGDQIMTTWQGQGTDSGDKAYYKAYTGAMKYFLLKTFLVPTGDDPEEEPQPRSQPQRAGAVQDKVPQAEQPTERLKPGPTSPAAKKDSEEEEREALMQQLRKWLSDAKLGRQLNVLIAEGLARRAAGGHYEEGMPLDKVPLKLLRGEIKHLEGAIEKHGLATALRDVTEWAPNHIEGEGGELRGPVPSPA